MKTCYVVTAGAYSDNHVVAVFSTKEKADSFAKSMDGSGEPVWVDEYIIDPPGTDQLIQGWKFFMVRMDRNGNEASAEVMEYRHSDAVRGGIEKSHWVDVICFCVARDEAHAIKIANERRTKAIALGEL